jgi:hypothetical protein
MVKTFCWWNIVWWDCILTITRLSHRGLGQWLVASRGVACSGERQNLDLLSSASHNAVGSFVPKPFFLTL